MTKLNITDPYVAWQETLKAEEKAERQLSDLTRDRDQLTGAIDAILDHLICLRQQAQELYAAHLSQCASQQGH